MFWISADKRLSIQTDEVVSPLIQIVIPNAMIDGSESAHFHR